MLTDLTIRNARSSEKPYKLTDSHGLYIDVRPTGSKLWRLRYRIDGKENLFALGEYPAKPIPSDENEEDKALRLTQGIFTLSEAREARLKARALIKQGIHPARERKFAVLRRRLENTQSFEAVAKSWMEEHGKEWSERYRYNIEQGFRKNVHPHLGKMNIGDIKPVHVLDVIDRIKSRSPTTAKVTRMWLGGVFRFAILRLLIEEDPTYPLKGLIKLAKVKHHRPLEARHIGGFLNAIDAVDAWLPTRYACQLLWLTLVRKNELLNAEWSEFDLDQALWRIPGPRMKMREDHVVPLSRQAVAILAALKRITGAHSFAFTSHMSNRKALGRAAIHNVFLRTGKALKFVERFTAHGIRSTFSTLANDAAIRPDVIERSLAHQEQNATRRAYNRATLLVERKELMQGWADMLDDFRQGKTEVSLVPRVTANPILEEASPS
jgi:integrase